MIIIIKMSQILIFFPAIVSNRKLDIKSGYSGKSGKFYLYYLLEGSIMKMGWINSSDG